MTKKDKIKFLDKIAIADTAFEVEGDSLSELFENSACALTMAMADIDSIGTSLEREIKLSGKKIDILLFDFLNELLFYKDSENLLFSKYRVEIKGNIISYELTASLSGEKADPKKHKITTDVKAVTLHMFEFKKQNGIYKARVIADI